MRKIFASLAALAVLAGCGNTVKRISSIDGEKLSSPDGSLEMVFGVIDGTPMYSLSFGGKTVVAPSKMGFEIYDEKADLCSGFTMEKADRSSFDEIWTPVWGEESQIRNNYNELFVCLKQSSTGRVMNIRFRLYDDGLGFRYEFPQENSLSYFNIKEELTEFAMTGDHTACGSPGTMIPRSTTIPRAAFRKLARSPRV